MCWSVDHVQKKKTNSAAWSKARPSRALEPLKDWSLCPPGLLQAPLQLPLLLAPMKLFQTPLELLWALLWWQIGKHGKYHYFAFLDKFSRVVGVQGMAATPPTWSVIFLLVTEVIWELAETFHALLYNKNTLNQKPTILEILGEGEAPNFYTCLRSPWNLIWFTG